MPHFINITFSALVTMNANAVTGCCYM